MQTMLVLYATREGHTRRIAEHLAATVRARDAAAEVVHAAHLPAGLTLANYSAVFIAGSVHAGQHEPELVRFVKEHRAELEQHAATAFLSVSLTEAGVELPEAKEELRQKSRADVQRMIDEFLQETGWHPRHIKAVAGALLYTQYNVILRFVMKRIARASGGSTDTSQDHVYTDWAALDHLVDEVLGEVRA